MCPLGLGLNTHLKAEKHKEIELSAYCEIMNFVHSTYSKADFNMETSSQCTGISEHCKQNNIAYVFGIEIATH